MTLTSWLHFIFKAIEENIQKFLRVFLLTNLGWCAIKFLKCKAKWFWIKGMPCRKFEVAK